MSSIAQACLHAAVSPHLFACASPTQATGASGPACLRPGVGQDQVKSEQLGQGTPAARPSNGPERSSRAQRLHGSLQRLADRLKSQQLPSGQEAAVHAARNIIRQPDRGLWSGPEQPRQRTSELEPAFGLPQHACCSDQHLVRTWLVCCYPSSAVSATHVHQPLVCCSCTFLWT